MQMLAIKLYSLAVNSMAEERTISTFTWLNSNLRNGQHAKTLVDMVQIRQWYMYQVRTIMMRPILRPYPS